MKEIRYIAIPGTGTHELPPLLVHSPVEHPSAEEVTGLRLTFRQPPPIDCFSNQFLFYLNSTMAEGAYQTWSHLAPEEPALLPPERFHFEVLDLGN